MSASSKLEKSSLPTPRVAMIQDGTRRRYIVPLGLQRAGILERVYTDWFARPGSTEAKIAGLVGQLKPSLGRRMREKFSPDLDASRIISNWFFSLRLQMQMRRQPWGEASYMYGSRRTTEWILRKGFGNANAVYGFIRNASPELFHAARERGLFTVGDQIIAPYEIEVREMAEQQRRWPEWKTSETIFLNQEYLQFERGTWQQLDRITCMSDYVQQGLISCGVSVDRITVIPHPWHQSDQTSVARKITSGPLTVGFVGGVGLRKGAPYFLEVARRFDPHEVKFVMVGELMVDRQPLEKCKNVEFTGAVAKSEVKQWLLKFDVFFFPSTCEGSAGAVMEAMAGGLPVLTTPNSGSRVRDGVDGFVYYYDQLDEFEAAIRRLENDRNLLAKMGDSARKRVVEYGLDEYAGDLRRLFEAKV